MEEIIIWSESWLPLLPLLIFIFYGSKESYNLPVVIYLVLAFILNTIANLIWQQNMLGLKFPTDNNNPIYNINSMLRLILFSLFFLRLKQPFAFGLKKALPVLFFLFVIVDLLLFENFFARIIANNLHAAEAGTLIIYSLLFYLFLINSEVVLFKKLPAFWIVTGLFIFVIISFPIYIFYNELVKSDNDFAIDVWEVQKVAFFIFCIFTSIGFYLSGQKQKLGDG